MTGTSSQLEATSRAETGSGGRSLKRLAVTGSAWTIGGYGVAMALRLASNLLVTRLLFPEAFGYMVIVNVVMIGLEMFSDIGVKTSIVQSPRGEDPVFLDTAWTVQVLRGLALWAVACLIGWPVAAFYDEMPLLVWLIPVAGFNAVIAGLQSTTLHTLHRQMEVRRLTIFEWRVQLAGVVVMVVWALVAPSVWALVAGGLAANVYKTAMSHAVLGGRRNRFAWERESWVELYRFGRWVFLSTAFTFLAIQSDKLVLGDLLSTGQLGIYGLAVFLTEAVSQLMDQMGNRIMLPTFSRVQRHEPERLREVYDKVRARLDPPALIGVGLLVAGGSVLIETLWDERWWAAGWMVQLLAVRLALHYTLPFAWAAQAARGELRYWLYGNIGRSIWLWVGLPLAWTLGGLEPTLWIVALAALPPLVACWIRMAHYGLLSLRRELLALVWLGVGLGLGKLGVAALG